MIMMTSPESPLTSSTRRGWLAPTNLATSIALVFPLFLIYQIGVLAMPDVGNGADLVTRRLLALLHNSTSAYLILNGAFAAGFLVLVLVLRRRQELRAARVLPVVLESGIYALTMGTLILQLMGMIGISPSLAVHAPTLAQAGVPAGLAQRIVLACGAGVHEELVFRLILLTAMLWLFERALGIRRGLALALGFVITAALFSAAHHVIGGEPWRVGVFVYRLFCGLIFAAIFHWRGFAVAVYTHTLYDIYVMVLG